MPFSPSERTTSRVQRCLRLPEPVLRGAGRFVCHRSERKLSGLPVSTVPGSSSNLQDAGFLDCQRQRKIPSVIACFSIGHAALGQFGHRRLSLPYLQASISTRAKPST